MQKHNSKNSNTLSSRWVLAISDGRWHRSPVPLWLWQRRYNQGQIFRNKVLQKGTTEYNWHTPHITNTCLLEGMTDLWVQEVCNVVLNVTIVCRVEKTDTLHNLIQSTYPKHLETAMETHCTFPTGNSTCNVSLTIFSHLVRIIYTVSTFKPFIRYNEQTKHYSEHCKLQ